MKNMLVPSAMALAFMLGISGDAKAAHVDADALALCQGEIATLQAETDDPSLYLGRNSDMNREGLVSKLEAANLKLSEALALLATTNKHNRADGKIDDALQKLADYQTKVIALRDAGKPKITADGATLLLYGVDETADGNGGVDGAITCINDAFV